VVSLIVVSSIFVGALVMMFGSFRLMQGPLSTSAGLFPLIVAVAMLLVAGLIIIGDVRRLRSAVGPAAPAPEALTGNRGEFKLLGAWVALAALYAVATPIVGFEIATFVMLTIALKFFGKASWPIIATVPIAVALILPFVFRHVFHTLIP
jgi:Tripartite tricarboxylate transporter TctB family